MNAIKKNANARIMFWLSVALMFTFSVSFLFMAPASKIALNDGNNGLLVFSGILFWLSLIGAYALFFFVNRSRKVFLKHIKKDVTSPPGLVRFFSNKPAKLADIATLASLVLFTIFALFTDSYFIYVFLSVFVFSFQMHCVLNGENYIYINSNKKVRRR